MPKCENCGHNIAEGFESCVICGNEFPMNDSSLANNDTCNDGTQTSKESSTDSHECKFCRHKNPVENIFCNACGKPFKNALTQPDDKSDPNITNAADSLRKDHIHTILSELGHINFALSLIQVPNDLASSELSSRLELRKIILWDILKKAVDEEIPERTNLSLEYFFGKVREIAREQGQSANNSSLFKIAISHGMDMSEFGLEPPAGIHSQPKSVQAIPQSIQPPAQNIAVGNENFQADMSTEVGLPSAKQVRYGFDWTGLWTTLYSENAMSSFLGFGILLITISSLVLLVNYWPNEDMRLLLMGLAFFQMAAFIGVGHLVKEQIGLYFSGLALITIGAVWSIFAAGIITYLIFDPISPEPKIPGIGLEINLIPLGWLLVAAISAPIWGVLSYRYRGYVLTHGFIFLAGLTIFLVIASVRQDWSLWKWALSPLPAYGLSLLYLKSIIGKNDERTLKHPLVWSALAIGISPPIILVYSSAFGGSNIPLGLSIAITALSSLEAVRHTSIRWLEHLSALLWPLATIVVINEFDSNSGRYIPLVLVSFGILYTFIGSKLRLSKPTSVEKEWPILKPWYGVSIILIITIPTVTSASTWSLALSMAIATLLIAAFSQKWKKQPWPWIPLIPFTLLLIYLTDLVPIQVSNISPLIGDEINCASNIDFSATGCFNLPLRPALISSIGTSIFLFLWFSKGKTIFSYPLSLWALSLTLISIVWSLIYEGNASKITFISPASLISILLGILSLGIIILLSLTEWFQDMWDGAKISIRGYLANKWEQKLAGTILDVQSLSATGLFFILVLIPLWLIAFMGYMLNFTQTLPEYSTGVWWIFTAIYTAGILKYKKIIWLYAGTITIQLGLITSIDLPSINLDINQIGLIISASAIVYISLVGIFYKYQISNPVYSTTTNKFIFLPLLIGGAIEAVVGLILSGWGDWSNWEGFVVTVIYTIISIFIAQISKQRFAPYATMILILLANTFAVGLIEGNWPSRAVGWALQGLSFWWIARGLDRFSQKELRYDLSLWIGPFDTSSTRTALFAGAFAFITLAANLFGIGSFDPDLLVPTSVIAILGLLYLGKAIFERNPLSGYIAASALLFSWYVQLLERDLSYLQIQLYAIPTGMYLLALAFFENRRKSPNRDLSIAANTLGVIILTGSAFIQSVIASDDTELIFVLIGVSEGVCLTIWGIFSKSKISFAGGILTFVVNILYQTTSLLSGTDGAIIGVILGLFIIILVIIIERTKSHLLLRGERFKEYIARWDW